MERIYVTVNIISRGGQPRVSKAALNNLDACFVIGPKGRDISNGVVESEDYEMVTMKPGMLKPDQATRVNVNTTVQEKSIAFLTDSWLYYRMRVALVRQSHRIGILLR